MSERLNALLSSMSTDDNLALVRNVQISKAVTKKKSESGKQSHNAPEFTPKKVLQSVKEVAKSLGGDIQRTESELLSKLLLHSDTGAAPLIASKPQSMNLKYIRSFFILLL